MANHRSIALFALVCLLLSGCDTVSDALMNTVQGEIKVACPKANIVADAAKRLAYRPGNGRDLTDIDNEVTIDSVSVGCKSDIDRRTRAGKVSATVNMEFTVARGPANRDRRVQYRYFVAVTDLADKVLFREAIDENILFAENETRLGVIGEDVILDIPIQAGQSGSSYRILVGMVLTREQLKFNRIDRRPRL